MNAEYMMHTPHISSGLARHGCPDQSHPLPADKPSPKCRETTLKIRLQLYGRYRKGNIEMLEIFMQRILPRTCRDWTPKLPEYTKYNQYLK
jgi:hypothetical protein